MDSTAPDISAPPIVERPALALWLFQRGLKHKDAAEPLGVGVEQVRRYCLPFDEPMRVVPPMPVMRRIVAWTKGEIGPGDFYPQQLRGGAANDEAASDAGGRRS